MNVNRKTAEELAALRRLVEASGADRTRWPAPERLRFAALLKTEPEARKLLAEAAALDCLLDMAPRVPESRHAALANRIEALAAGLARDPAADAPVGANPARPLAEQPDTRGLPGVTDLAAVRSGRAGRSRPQPSAFRSGWQAAGLLAASLVLGILVGGTGLLTPAFGGLPGVAAADGDLDGQHLALGLDRAGTADEETL